MPDLSSQGTHQYWSQYPDPIIYRVVTFMESVENWTLENSQQFEEAMKRLGDALDDIGNIDLQEEDNLIKLCAQLKCGRSLRLLQCMDTAHPGAASKLLTHAEMVTASSDDFPSIFLRRNVVFERLRLLERIFTPERLALVTKALEESEHV
jgi:intracellular multiplication protein IcmW